MKSNPHQDEYSEADAEQRRAGILNNLLHMPPEQYKAIKAKRAKQRTKRHQSPSQ